MKKKFTLLIVLLLGLHLQVGHAQQGTVATGGDLSGSGGSASYSTGLVAYATATGSGGIATEGIQQAFEIYVLDKDDFESIRLTVQVYPNPTANTLYLSFEADWDKDTRFELYDMTGKLLRAQKVTALQTAIDMERLPTAMYFLKVYAGHTTIKHFKILKKDR